MARVFWHWAWKLILRFKQNSPLLWWNIMQNVEIEKYLKFDNDSELDMLSHIQSQGWICIYFLNVILYLNHLSQRLWNTYISTYGWVNWSHCLAKNIFVTGYIHHRARCIGIYQCCRFWSWLAVMGEIPVPKANWHHNTCLCCKPFLKPVMPRPLCKYMVIWRKTSIEYNPQYMILSPFA